MSKLKGKVAVARELGPRKIRVNALNPGFIATEGTAGYMGGDLEKFFLSNTPLGRVGQRRDIASVATFLASDDSVWLTGEQLIASGRMR
jgi:3-oxoacyl-[acyl-carrier protein] reductase